MIKHLIQLIAKSILNNMFLTSLLHVSLTNSWLFIIHRAVCWITYCIINQILYHQSDTVSSLRYCIINLWNDFRTRSYSRIDEKTAFQFSFRTRNFHGSFTRRQPGASVRRRVRVPSLYACAIPTALGCGSVAGTRGETRNIRNTRSVERWPRWTVKLCVEYKLKMGFELL